MTDELRKRFSIAVGKCWNRMGNTGHAICCSKCHTVHHNPTFDNPVDIMQAIKNVPCGKCEDGHIQCPYPGCMTMPYKCTDEHHCDLGSGKYPCSCNNGVIDEWDGFMEWHQDQFDGLSMVMSTFDKGFLYRIIGHASAEILLTPSLLMQDYLSYKEVE